MFPHRLIKPAVSFIFCLTCCMAAQKEEDDVVSFLRSVAATVYKLAWPTATYKSVEFAGLQREPEGIAVVMKLSGEGLFGDNLWLKLGVVVNGNGIQDVKVIGDNALFAAPFATSKALAHVAAELGKEYANRRPANQPVSQPTPTQTVPAPLMAGAICLMNPTYASLAFIYRWGDEAWQRDEITAGNSSLYWWKYPTAEHSSPRFDIRYHDSLAPGDTEQAYWLERTATSLPVSCDQASRYSFGIEGQKVVLHKVD